MKVDWILQIELTRTRAINNEVHVVASHSGKVFLINTSSMQATLIHDCKARVCSRPLVIDNYTLFGCCNDRLVVLQNQT